MVDYQHNDAFGHLYEKYRNGASHRGLSFQLTAEQFHAFARGNCHYCGIKPIQLVQKAPKARGFHHAYTYNGIDRVDNDRGYALDNCVSCCGRCNRAKYKATLAEFAEWALRLVAHLKSNRAVKVRSSTDAPLRGSQEKPEHDPPINTSVPASNGLTIKALKEALE